MTSSSRYPNQTHRRHLLHLFGEYLPTEISLYWELHRTPRFGYMLVAQHRQSQELYRIGRQEEFPLPLTETVILQTANRIVQALLSS